MVDRCCMCKRNEESVDILHCNVASALWSTLFIRFGMSWVMPRRVIDFFACCWTSERLRSAGIWKSADLHFFVLMEETE